MPLNKTCSIEAFRQNIAEEAGKGVPMDQAVAIARSTLEAACEAEGKPVPRSEKKKPKDVNYKPNPQKKGSDAKG